LAEQGYIVDLLDISRVGLLRAQTEAGERGLRNINLMPVDFDHFELEPNRYDLVCVFRYLKHDFFTPIRQTVRPGGRVIYATFNRRYLDLVPGFNPAFLLDIGELGGYFADWKIVHAWEETHISRIVAIKPE
jgi:SAM-dependent methyltransferase